MKRLRVKLTEEFKKESDKFKMRGMKFRLDDKNQVYLMWSIYGGRYVSLKNDFTMIPKNYKNDLSDVPFSILRASIKYFKECERDEEKFRNTRMKL